MKTTFYLVRHGQPDWDWAEAMRFYGPCSAYMPLTPLGVEQIEHTACDSQLRGASFILASPYTRTMQSAQILSRRLDLPVTVEWNCMNGCMTAICAATCPLPANALAGRI